MSSVTYVGDAESTHATNTTVNVTVPSARQPNDLIVVNMITNSAISTVNNVSGFNPLYRSTTSLYNDSQTVGSYASRTRAWWKISDGTEGSITVPGSGSTGAGVIAQVMVFRNVDFGRTFNMTDSDMPPSVLTYDTGSSLTLTISAVHTGDMGVVLRDWCYLGSPVSTPSGWTQARDTQMPEVAPSQLCGGLWSGYRAASSEGESLTLASWATTNNRDSAGIAFLLRAKRKVKVTG